MDDVFGLDFVNRGGGTAGGGISGITRVEADERYLSKNQTVLDNFPLKIEYQGVFGTAIDFDNAGNFVTFIEDGYRIADLGELGMYPFYGTKYLDPFKSHTSSKGISIGIVDTDGLSAGSTLKVIGIQGDTSNGEYTEFALTDAGNTVFLIDFSRNIILGSDAGGLAAGNFGIIGDTLGTYAMVFAAGADYSLLGNPDGTLAHGPSIQLKRGTADGANLVLKLNNDTSWFNADAGSSTLFLDGIFTHTSTFHIQRGGNYLYMVDSADNINIYTQGNNKSIILGSKIAPTIASSMWSPGVGGTALQIESVDAFSVMTNNTIIGLDYVSSNSALVGNRIIYGSTYTKIIDNTATHEYGKYGIKVMSNGTLFETVSIDHAGMILYGILSLAGSTSGFVQMYAPAITSTYSLIWPAAQGGANTIPLNDGSGNLSWVVPSSVSYWTLSSGIITNNNTGGAVIQRSGVGGGDTGTVPVLTLYFNSDQSDTGGYTANLDFKQNHHGLTHTFGRISSRISDPDNTNYAGAIDIWTAKNGTLVKAMDIEGTTGVIIYPPTYTDVLYVSSSTVSPVLSVQRLVNDGGAVVARFIHNRGGAGAHNDHMYINYDLTNSAGTLSNIMEETILLDTATIGSEVGVYSVSIRQGGTTPIAYRYGLNGIFEIPTMPFNLGNSSNQTGGMNVYAASNHVAWTINPNLTFSWIANPNNDMVTAPSIYLWQGSAGVGAGGNIQLIRHDTSLHTNLNQDGNYATFGGTGGNMLSFFNAFATTMLLESNTHMDFNPSVTGYIQSHGNQPTGGGIATVMDTGNTTSGTANSDLITLSIPDNSITTAFAVVEGHSSDQTVWASFKVTGVFTKTGGVMTERIDSPTENYYSGGSPICDWHITANNPVLRIKGISGTMTWKAHIEYYTITN